MRVLGGLIVCVCDAEVFGELHIWGLNLAPSALCGLRQQKLNWGWYGLSLAWEGVLPQVGMGDGGGSGGRRRRALGRVQCEKQCQQFIVTDTPMDLKCLPTKRLLPPAPMPKGVYGMVTQLCFRSWEECSQGTTRISKSQRSFCRESRERRRGEAGSQA